MFYLRSHFAAFAGSARGSVFFKITFPLSNFLLLANYIGPLNRSRHNIKEEEAELTVFVHVSFVALVQPTGSALVAMRLVDRTLSVEFALRLTRVDASAMDGPLEEPTATCITANIMSEQLTFERIGSECPLTVARVDAVVFTRTPVAAHQARDV